MKEWIFDQRAKALEEAFFRKRELELMAEYKKSLCEKDLREQFRAMTPIQDEKIIDAACGFNLSPETLVALTLVPLIEVAKADKIISANEVESLLQIAKNLGIQPGSPAFELLKSWVMGNEGRESGDYSEELFKIWAAYMEALKSRDEHNQYRILKEQILTWSEKVAKASGGFLGLGSISKEEELTLNKIKQVLH